MDHDRRRASQDRRQRQVRGQIRGGRMHDEKERDDVQSRKKKEHRR